MVVRNLADVAFEDLVLCFLKSFKNYYVEMPTEVNYYRDRFAAAKVRYDLSYGMFQGKQLIGFIVHGIDHRRNQYIAYNTGTGVLPEFRGRRIVQDIYEFAIEDLRKHGINLCSLEVIKENVIALRCYKAIGFNICRSYKCYNGTIAQNGHASFELKELSFDELNWNDLPNQEHYSWDNHKNSLKLGACRYYLILSESNEIGYFVMNPENGYLAQFDVLNESSHEGWKLLFSAIQTISETVKINNVDEALPNRCALLESLGLENSIYQYEM